MRSISGNTAPAARPFAGEGHSVYATAGTAVAYRRLRGLSGNRSFVGTDHGFGSTGIPKTQRISFFASPATSDVIALPAGLIDTTIAVDVRTYENSVEGEVFGGHQTLTTDSGGDGIAEILGTAQLDGIECLAGGEVRLTFSYIKSETGVQPERFLLKRTAGPTSPADIVVDVSNRETTNPITFVVIATGLSDASAYTFKLTADAPTAPVVPAAVDLITGISVTADATGPPAPTSATTRPV